jgi:hypothetical protein
MFRAAGPPDRIVIDPILMIIYEILIQGRELLKCTKAPSVVDHQRFPTDLAWIARSIWDAIAALGRSVFDRYSLWRILIGS